MSITWYWHQGRRLLKRARSTDLILVFRQKRQRMNLDAFLGERTCILGCRLAVDAAFLGFL